MALLPPVKYEMGADLFYIHRFPPFLAIKVFGELQKAVFPILGGVAKGIKHVDIDSPLENLAVIGELLGDGFIQFAANLDGEKLEKLSIMLLSPDYVAVKRNGKKEAERLTEDVMNEIFEGRAFDVLILMVQVAKANYADFTRLSGVPTGLREALGEIARVFRERFLMISDGASSSTEPSNQE